MRLLKHPLRYFGLSLVLLIPALCSAKTFETFFGNFDVEEPVLIELLESNAMQRLKKINQYGVATFTTHRENYSRYDHSLGVFAVLRMNQAPIKEQVAGLIHDVSHTVFSHVGDWIFKKEYQDKDYQNCTHQIFLKNSGLSTILKKHGYTTEELEPTQENFPMLECPLPHLCADRIDYNIQGAFHRGMITKEEAMSCVKSLSFKNGHWVSDRPDLMKKIVYFSLFMTEECWGSPENFYLSRYLADAILKAVELNDISMEEIHFGYDEVLWRRLINHDHPYIQKKMHRVRNIDQFIKRVEPKKEALQIKSKFRGINPLIKSGGKILPLLSFDPTLFDEFKAVKKRCEEGRYIQITE